MRNGTFWVKILQLMWEKYATRCNFQIFLSSFSPKMGFQRKFWSMPPWQCNYQNCNLWLSKSSMILKGFAHHDFCLWCSIIMHSWLKARTICFSSTVCLRASGFKNIMTRLKLIVQLSEQWTLAQWTVKRKLASCMYATLTKKNHFLLPSMTFMTRV